MLSRVTTTGAAAGFVAALLEVVLVYVAGPMNAVVVSEVPAAVGLRFVIFTAQRGPAGDAFAASISVDNQDALASWPGEDPLPARVGGDPPLLVVVGASAALASGVEMDLLPAG